MSKEKPRINPGIYNCAITRIVPGKDPGTFTLTFEAIDLKLEATKFCIYHAPTKTYTVIGAKNIHHASNKAAKLWGDSWTGIARETPSNVMWKFIKVRDFKDVIKSAL